MKKLLYLFLGLLFISQHIVAQVPSSVPTDGLVGYWPFNGNANDETGNGNNGTVNGAILSTDRFGSENNSYFFDGNASKIYFNLNSIENTIPSGSELTTSLWVKSSDLNGPLISMRGGNILYDFNIGTLSDILISPGNYGIFVRDVCCGTGNNKFASNPIDGNWHMLTIVRYSNGLMHLYKDGLLDEVTEPGNNGELVFDSEFMTFGAEEVWIVGAQGSCGSCNSVDQQHLNGQLDDIGIWNRALTEQEVANLYASNSSNECSTLVINTGILSTNPVAYNSTVNIYPNPANDQITIDCGNLDNVEGWNIKITNMLGQEVFSQPMNTQQYVIPLNTWTGQGMYFVKIINAQNEVVNIKKIVLQ
jgi:hypothetical protein